jgi:PAS domain-containing protein
VTARPARSRREQIELILRVGAGGVYGIDLDGRHLANPAAARILVFAPGDLVGRDMHDLVHHTASTAHLPAGACPMHSRCAPA